jgi:hypothetical protein
MILGVTGAGGVKKVGLTMVHGTKYISKGKKNESEGCPFQESYNPITRTV